MPTNEQTITYTNEEGEEVDPDDIAAEIDEHLESSTGIFVRGSDGNRYLVSVRVTFDRCDES
jgi:hypothetical protein